MDGSVAKISAAIRRALPFLLTTRCDALAYRSRFPCQPREGGWYQVPRQETIGGAAFLCPRWQGFVRMRRFLVLICRQNQSGRRHVLAPRSLTPGQDVAAAADNRGAGDGEKHELKQRRPQRRPRRLYLAQKYREDHDELCTGVEFADV